MTAGNIDEEVFFDMARQMTDPVKRTEYLERSCGGDATLINRIESLIASSEEAERFFSEGSGVVNNSEEFKRLSEIADGSLAGDGEFLEEKVGVKIGHYNLIKRIGDGGCGVVYLAEQEEPVRRMVAMKIVRVGMESEHIIARFKAERQALAMMDHPNIARVFDAGETNSGSPYFVMEHVRGTRITEYCDRNHLSIRQRMDLFVQICHAIQHAHQKGIIHGDIKPSNIMVCEQDGVAIPKVIDFGIARVTESRLTDKNPFNKKEHLMGTPAYMSPEQMEMNGFDVDTRSDIYSLGVLLYELLISLTPFDGKRMMQLSPREMRELLQLTVPLLPSSRIMELKSLEISELALLRNTTPAKLIYFLKYDLDFVVRKALEKDRNLRYETSNAMAMDVQRFLNNEVVLSHPHSWSYNMGKFIRRNKGAFLAGSLIMLTLVSGMGLSTWLFLREREAKQRAVAAEQQQMHLREEAEVREKITQAAWMVSQERFTEAEKIILDVEFKESSVEGAAVHRWLGEWHAIHGRWKEASERFKVLLTVNQFESADVSSLDYLELGPVLIALDDDEGYEQFRLDAIERFRHFPSLFADRFVKISLLKPANISLMQALSPIASLAAQFAEKDAEVGDYFEAAWGAMSIALFEYRRGNYAGAFSWCKRCMDYPDTNAPRSVTIHSILALSYHMTAKKQEALVELEQGLSLFHEKYRGGEDRGTPVHGFWFDWAFAHILIEEAQRIVSPE